ncbi:MRPS23 family protein [Megaselia abdita]
MAQSRLEKIGTIFSRTTGLLKSGAMKFEDRPIWYDVYAAFPPALEPRYDRPAPNINLRSIYYQEDIIRAKYQKVNRPEVLNLLDHSKKTQTQEFIEIYNNLKSEGALDEEKIMEVGKSMLEDRLKTRREEAIVRSEERRASEEVRSENTVKQSPPPKRQLDVADILSDK